MMRTSAFLAVAASVVVLLGVTIAAEQKNGAGASRAPVTAPASAEFLIGAEDVLGVLFWREKDISGDVTVRPDGIITLPLLGDIRAAGKTPTGLAMEIQTLAARYLNEPSVTVVVRQINSRKVYITGEVNAPGAYPLTGPRTVMQAIALAGGVLEYARVDEITILREVQGKTQAFRFNYSDVSKGRKLDLNIELQPGDTIVVP
jgi:polysaccharide export outer membrane protein